MNMFTILKDLYDSEINVRISSFWDAGWKVEIGDETNGFKQEIDLLRTEQLDIALLNMAIEQYPDSKFAEKYKETMELDWRQTS